MVDNRQIGIAIPSYNRSEMTVESFADVHDDERIAEITIVDDASEDKIYLELKESIKQFPKVRLFRNKENKDCYVNKATSLVYSNCDWNILLDSDNKIGKDYLDNIFEHNYWSKEVSYMPSFAFPNFNYKQFEGLIISRENVSAYMDEPMFSTMLNCMNFFVNKHSYLECWNDSVNPYTADSIYFNYCWFNIGNKMLVVPNLSYYHRVHSQSHYILNQHRTGSFYNETEQKIRQLV